MPFEPTLQSKLREIAEGPIRDLPTPEETLKAEAKARVNREKAAKGRAGQLLGAGGAASMPDDIAERFMRDLPKTLAKIAAYRKGVAKLEAKLRTSPLQSLEPDDVNTMFEALFHVASDGFAIAEQAIGRLQVERNEAQATVAKLTRELAQAKGQRTALRAVPGDRGLPDDDPPEPPDAA
jgi:hypothetical protein